MKQLKWQTVSQRIDYYLATLMYNSVHGNAPAFLYNSITMACECNDINTRASNTLKVMRKSFTYIGSAVWNDLPAKIHESASCDVLF